jgi:predicted nucleic acid-binding protein
MAVLDTSFLIDLERGSDAALAALDHMVDERRPIRVPAQAAAEYVSGFEDPVANLNDLERSYEVLAHDREHLLETAQLARAAFVEGAFPGWTYTQIAAAAVLADEPVLTADPGDFDALGCAVWAYREEMEPPTGSS